MNTSMVVPPGSKLAVILGDGGLRFTAHLRGHEVTTDQPHWAGGEDSAPMPLELLSAALGTCIALYAQQFCATRAIPCEGLSVEVRSESATAPKRISRFLVRVVLPDTIPAEYRDAIERAVRTCPVHNTFMHPPEIVTELVTK